jgi:hypothetical protein
VYRRTDIAQTTLSTLAFETCARRRRRKVQLQYLGRNMSNAKSQVSVLYLECEVYAFHLRYQAASMISAAYNGLWFGNYPQIHVSHIRPVQDLL